MLLAAYISYSGNNVAMAYLQQQYSIGIGSFDRSRLQHQKQRQRQQPRLSGLALLSQFKTTDNCGMPVAPGNQRRGLHEHGGQVRLAVTFTCFIGLSRPRDCNRTKM